MRDTDAVFLGYSQAELDAQYDQTTLVPEVGDYIARWTEESAATKRRLAPVERAYGAHPDERIDLYPGHPEGPVHLHVHGGAWRRMSKEAAGFVANGLAGDRTTLAVVNFTKAPEAGLPEIVDQVRRAFVWLWEHTREAGAAAPRITVSGHSSGGHLAGCLIDPAWREGAGLPREALGGLVLASGIYDLEPVLLSARNEYLHLTAAGVERLSPIRRLGRDLPPVAVFWGAGELAEFKRQSTAFAAALRQAGCTAAAQELPDRNHFDVYDLFADPSSPIARAVRDLA